MNAMTVSGCGVEHRKGADIAGQLVNTAQDSLETNERVQECLTNVKQVRKQIVRYIQASDCRNGINSPYSLQCRQLVENEDMIGVLIETNDRIIAALENYDLVRFSVV